MSTLEDSRAAINALVDVGMFIARSRDDKKAFSLLDAACQELLEQDEIDFEYLDTALRSRPTALNALMSVNGGLLDVLIEEVFDEVGSSELIEWLEACDEEIEQRVTRIAAESKRPAVGAVPESIVVFRPASPAPGRSGNAMIGDYHFFNERALDGRILWDRRIFDIPYPAVAMLGAAAFVSDFTYDARVLPRWQPCPLFRFHPERFKQTRSWYLKPIQALRKNRPAPKSNNEAVMHFNLEAQHIIQESANLSARTPLKGRQVGTDALDGELSLFVLFDQFQRCGRQIFDIPPILSEMFRNTDVENVPIDMLHSPYESFFLHFGPQDDLELEENWSVDGAYITHMPKSKLLQVVLVARPKDDAAVRLWHSTPEPCYAFVFDESTATMDVGMALDTVLSAKLAEYDKQIAGGNAEMEANLKRARGELESRGVDLSKYQISARVAEGAAKRAQVEKKRFPVFREALRLVINSICYLTAYPEDSDSVWPDDTPVALRTKAVSSNEKEAKRAKSKLEALGYSAVHTCGQYYRQKEPGLNESTGQTVKRHWRKGHWLRQFHGEGRLLRKLQWRMPRLINRHLNPDDPVDGHIYMVD